MGWDKTVKFLNVAAPYNVLNPCNMNRIINKSICWWTVVSIWNFTWYVENTLKLPWPILIIHNWFVPYHYPTELLNKLAVIVDFLLILQKFFYIVKKNRVLKINNFTEVLLYIVKEHSTKNRNLFCSINKESIGSSFIARINLSQSVQFSTNHLAHASSLYLPHMSRNSNYIPYNNYSVVNNQFQHSTNSQSSDHRFIAMVTDTLINSVNFHIRITNILCHRQIIPKNPKAMFHILYTNWQIYLWCIMT